VTTQPKKISKLKKIFGEVKKKKRLKELVLLSEVIRPREERLTHKKQLP